MHPLLGAIEYPVEVRRGQLQRTADAGFVFVQQVEAFENFPVTGLGQFFQGSIKDGPNAFPVDPLRLPLYMWGLQRNYPIFLVHVTLFLAEVLDGQIDRNLAQKPAQSLGIAQLPGPELLQRDDEGVLAEILGKLRVAGALEKNEPKAVGIALNQFGFRYRIPLENSYREALAGVFRRVQPGYLPVMLLDNSPTMT